jgi:hypothetical protein
MGKIKHDPKEYLRRSDIGIDVKVVSRNRKVVNKSKKDLADAVIDAGFYIKFKPPESK